MVLLFGSETRNLTPVLLTWLEGFHIQCVHWMAWTHKHNCVPGNTWTYLVLFDVLMECGILTVEEYIQCRWQTVVAWVVDYPLFEACWEGKWMRGTPHCQWQWDQEMALNMVPPTVAIVSDADSTLGDSAPVGSKVCGWSYIAVSKRVWL